MPPVQVLELEPAPSDDVPDDLVGIHQANDLMRLLPSEAVMLGLPELELEFYRRYLGAAPAQLSVTWHLAAPAHHAAHSGAGGQPVAAAEPFIVCVDTSGSMGGYPEECAKALFLALLKVAMDEKRGCYT